MLVFKSRGLPAVGCLQQGSVNFHSLPGSFPKSPWVSTGDFGVLWPSQPFPCVSSCAACGEQPRGRGEPGGAWRQCPPASCQAGHSSDKGQLFGGVVVLLGAPNPWNNCCDRHSNHLQRDRHIGAFQVQGSQPPPQPLFSLLFENFQKQDGELEAQALDELSGVGNATFNCLRSI